MTNREKKQINKFQAVNEFVQIEPIKYERKSKIVIAELTKKQSATGKVLSVGEGRMLPDGTFIKPPVEVGDIIMFNPHLCDPVDYNGEDIFIVNAIGIYGKEK